MSTAKAKAKLRCEAPGCEQRAYSNLSNLKRHTNSKHSQAVQMSCGKSFPNHPSNLKRHMETCGCATLNQPPVLAGRDGADVSTSATTSTLVMPTFDDSLYSMGNFNDTYYTSNFASFGLFG